MLDFLYSFFIAPLEYWMEVALIWAHNQTGHWGEAIILMSLLVNFVILPIYMKAESWQEEERAIAKSFADKEAMIRRTFKGQERFAMLSTMQRQAHYSPLLKLRSSVGFILQVPFFFAAYHFLSHFELLAGVSFLGLPDLAKPDALIHLGSISINVMPFVMTVVNLASALIYTKNLTKKDKNQLYAMAAIFLVLLYDAASGLVLYWTINNVFSLVKNAIFARFNVLERFSDYRGSLRLSAPGFVFLTFGLLYLPQLVLNSDINSWDVSSILVMVDGILAYFVAGLYLFSLFVFLFPLRFGRGLYFVLILLVGVALCYGTIFTGDYGTLQGLRFEKPDALYAKWSNRGKDFCILVVLIGLTCFLVREKFQKFIRVLSLAIIAVMFVSSATSITTIQATEANRQVPIKEKEVALKVEYENRLTTFSKNGKNIFVFILDMFTGEHVDTIIKDYPELVNGLDGFVWYEDTLSSGSGTCFGLPAIYGGEEYTYANLEKRGLPLNPKTLGDASYVIPKALGKEWNSFVGKADFVSAISNDKSVWPGWFWFKYFARNSWSKDLEKSFTQNSLSKLYSLVAFKAIPYTMRNRIYKGGKWLFFEGFTTPVAANEYTVFEKILREIKVGMSLNNTYKAMHTQLTHNGCACSDVDFRPLITATIPNSKKKDAFRLKHPNISYEHYITEVSNLKVLVKIFEKMKLLGVYDNTRIILVSDHGAWDSEKLLVAIGKQPFRDNFYGKKVNPGMRSALLLVKDFNERGNLRINRKTLMSNYDVRSIVLEGILGEKNLSAGYKERNNPNRVRYYESGPVARNKNNEQTLHTLFQVRGTMYIPENWSVVFTRDSK